MALEISLSGLNGEMQACHNLAGHIGAISVPKSNGIRSALVNLAEYFACQSLQNDINVNIETGANCGQSYLLRIFYQETKKKIYS
jgi:hypothetical protein